MMRLTSIAMMCCLFSIALATRSQEDTYRSQEDTYICTIRSKVIDEKGSPISGATVYADALGVIHASITPHIETDKNGEFVLEHLQPFTYLIYAIKGHEQFYEQSFSLITDDLSPQIKLTTQSPVVEITLRIRPQPGVINISVTDAITSCSVNPNFDIWRTDEPRRHMGGGVQSKWALLTPPDKQVSLRIGADGYKDWYYPGGNNPDNSTPIKLKSGEEMALNIKLEPISPVVCPESIQYPEKSIQSSGIITGDVLDEFNKPVSGMVITAHLLNEKFSVIASRNTVTNELGGFKLEKLALGTYRFVTQKTEDSYPTTNFSLYETNPQPPVVLSEPSPSVNVVLHVGPKAGLLNADVLDAVTGERIKASLFLWDLSDPKTIVTFQTTDVFHVFVPASKGTGLKVTSVGHEDWYYPGTSNAIDLKPITLASDEKLELTIRLQPSTRSK